MISTFLLSIINSFLSFIFGTLPVGSLPTTVTDAISYISGVLNLFSYILPITQLFIVLSLVISIELVIWVFHSFLFIYHKIRGI